MALKVSPAATGSWLRAMRLRVSVSRYLRMRLPLRSRMPLMRSIQKVRRLVFMAAYENDAWFFLSRWVGLFLPVLAGVGVFGESSGVFRGRRAAPSRLLPVGESCALARSTLLGRVGIAVVSRLVSVSELPSVLRLLPVSGSPLLSGVFSLWMIAPWWLWRFVLLQLLTVGSLTV